MFLLLRFFRIGCVVAAAIALVAYFGCNHQTVDTGPPKPVIAVSIFPVASLVGQLTSGWADVVTLLPDGASEHAFELTADQVRQLSRADLLVLVGNGLDAWAEPKPGMTSDGKQAFVLRMGDLIGNLGEEKDLDASCEAKTDAAKTDAAKTDAAKTDAAKTDAAKTDAAKTNDSNAAPAIAAPAAPSDDPDVNNRNVARRGPPPPPTPDSTAPKNNHLWLDPVLARRFVHVIASQLETRYPQHKTEIAEATVRLAAELQQMDQRYRSELSNVRRRELITFHNAFDLIAHRYGLIVVARLTDIESDSHGGITPASYLAAIKAINKYGLMAIYSEPEFSAQEIASIRRETAVEVLTLDPLGGPSIEGYRTYQEMMRSNLKTLVKGQGLETMAPPEMLVVPSVSSHAPSRSVDSDFDAPLKIPSTTKQPKEKPRPSLFSEPDLSFPRIVPKGPTPSAADPLAPKSNPSPPSPAAPFRP